KGPVTVAELNLKFIWDVVSRIKIGDKGKAYVVDQSGLLVADPDIGLVLRKTSMAELAHVKAAAGVRSADEPAMLSHDLAGTKVLTSMAPIDPVDWNVFVEQPVSEVFAKLNASILLTAGLLLSGLVVSALAAGALARSMVRPIRTLDEGAKRIGAGDLDQQIVVRTGDELEGLADQFNRMTAQLRESYAGLERKVEQRTAEVREALDYQTAISEVLRVISSSPTDVQPVFEAIMDSAQRLFGTTIGAVFHYDGRMVQLAATRGWSSEALEDARRLYPAPPNPATLNGRVILSCQAQTIADTHADPAYDPATLKVGQWRRMVGAPMVKDGLPIGAIVVAWGEPGETPQRQAALLKTFADQAVIAIENVRLFNETREALERQTATAEILKVISASPTDVQPVLEAVAERSGLLCRAEGSRVWLPEGDHLRAMTNYGRGYEAIAQAELLPIRGGSIGGRAFVERRCVHVEDVLPLIDSEYPDVRELQARYGFRTVLAVPMLRDGVSVGVISLLRNEVRPFTQTEIGLVQTFADQAVIAIENVRLFNETKEALEQQIATAEVLQVISNSVADAEPVFEAVLNACQRLFEGFMVGINLRGDDGQVHFGAYHGPQEDAVRAVFPVPYDHDSGTRPCIEAGRALDYPDIEAEGVPLNVRRASRISDARAVAFAPLLFEGRGLGSLWVSRRAPGALGEKQMALLKTFADQAVIAIQNARLFNETKEALEQQTATAEVLKAISRTTFELDSVLGALIENATRLCKSDRGFVFIRDGDEYRPTASYGATPEQLEFMSHRHLTSTSGTLVGRAVQQRQVVQIEDARHDPDYAWEPAFELLGFRTMLGVPMLREGEPIGVVAIWRDQVRPFS
ncbi:MAG: GAF domain-containing protein, partial [Burkholderiaceae bacterium]|nr:GAF domain-containing protein [Burkholderiaceae bacterium]